VEKMPKEEQIKFETMVEEKIKEIDSTMSLEGMPLTKEFKDTLKGCFNRTTTTEKERKKIIERYKRIYGRQV
jgi:hypothetical protein